MMLVCPQCGLTWPDDYDASCCDCGYEIDQIFPTVVAESGLAILPHYSTELGEEFDEESPDA